MTAKKEDFLRISGDLDFQNRSDSIFGSLDNLEPEQKSETESKPHGPRAPKHVPDHVLHPQKWTKYSLEDDGTDKSTGMSGEALNRHVALSFLDDIRKRKEDLTMNSESESDVVMTEKHVFSKSAIKHKMEIDEAPLQSQIVEGVNIMKEYVVGLSPAKTTRREYKKLSGDKKLNSSGESVSLGHLEEREVGDSDSDISAGVSEPVEEQHEKVKFAKRKVKKRSGLREHKSTAADE